MRSPLTRRDALRSLLKSASFAGLPGAFLRPSMEALTIGRILSARYVPSEPRLWIIAEAGKPGQRSPLYVDDVILLVSAVAMLLAHPRRAVSREVETFGFSLERLGSRMIPTFFPAFLDPLLAGSAIARTTLELDLYLKRSGLGLPGSLAKTTTSEIAMLAAYVARRLANGDTVETLRRSAHRFFFDLSCVTDVSDGFRHVNYPDPIVRVVMPPESSARATFEPEIQFAALVEASFKELLVREDALGAEARRLRNLFILAKIAFWILQDSFARVDIARLSRFPTALFTVPHVSVRAASRVVVDQSTGEQITVQIAGGVRFQLAGSRKAQSDSQTLAMGQANRLDGARSPPDFSVYSTTVNDIPCVAIDISSILGLRRERTS